MGFNFDRHFQWKDSTQSSFFQVQIGYCHAFQCHAKALRGSVQ
jgi:hypothetical protein